MSVEVWARNPYHYVRECIEVGIAKVVWDRGILIKRRIDARKFMDLYYGVRIPWKALIVGGDVAIEIDHDHPESNPCGHYPIWKYGEDLVKLEKFIALNMFNNKEHKVIITELPAGNSNIGKSFIRLLSEIQEENPEVTLHIHGMYSYRNMYGLAFKSVDVDGRTYAANNQIELPNGKRIRIDAAPLEFKWVNLLGMYPVDLKIPRNRCIFNLKSHLWASRNFKNNINFSTDRNHKPDITSPVTVIPERKGKPFTLRKVKLDSDLFLCNLCSLQSNCAYFREGAVCIVPDTEASRLAELFKTRDSHSIIEGLSNLLAAQSHRLEKALDAEEDKRELHPETRRLINDIFDRGVRLAKLVDPTLAAAGAPHTNIQNNTAILNTTPQKFMAAIVDEFVKRGIPAGSITPDMIMKVINQPESLKSKAIEVAVTEKLALDAGG